MCSTGGSSRQRGLSGAGVISGAGNYGAGIIGGAGACDISGAGVIIVAD